MRGADEAEPCLPLAVGAAPGLMSSPRRRGWLPAWAPWALCAFLATVLAASWLQVELPVVAHGSDAALGPSGPATLVSYAYYEKDDIQAR